MYENGQLAELVSQFLELPITFTYNTVSDMVASENFADGSIAKTLGFYSVNDGGGATYLIRTKEISDTADNIHLFDRVKGIGKIFIAERDKENSGDGKRDKQKAQQFFES